MADARGFGLQIDREFDEVLETWERVVRAVALEALSRIVLRTPVDTGRARGNWFVQIGEAGVEVTSDVDPAGGVTISAGEQVIGTFRLEEDGGPDIVIYNNLPYINALENGGSQQARAGMVAITVAELEAGL